MAVLEKIRKRSVLLFIIIIGALLAFILGDFINSGRTFIGPGDAVMKVGNVKVKQTELADFGTNFDAQIKQQIENAQRSGQRVPPEYLDPDFLHTMKVQQLLYQNLLAEECEKMGIEINDDLLSAAIFSPYAQGQVNTILFGGQPQAFAQMGIADPASYLDAIKNPARYQLTPEIAQQLAANWSALENEVEKQLRNDLYAMAVSGLFQPNKADAMVNFENNNTTADVDYVSIPYASVKDSEAELTDADYKAVYEPRKEAYKIKDETREVAYIVVPIIPSAQDRQTAVDEVTALKAGLQTAEGMTALSEFKNFTTPETYKMTAKQYGQAFSADSVAPAVGHVLQPQQFTLAKVVGTEQGIDNVVFDFYMAENVAQLDSVFPSKTLAAVDSIITLNTQGQLANITTSLVNPTQIAAQFLQIPSLQDNITNATLNEYASFTDTVNGQPLAYALIVKERSTPETFYEVTAVTRNVYPSNATRQDLTQKLHAYVVNNGNAKAFTEGKDYVVNYSLISPESYTIANSATTPGTRSTVKWAMNADKGKVSPVFTKQKTIATLDGNETEEYLIAVAVVDVYDDYVPATSKVVKDDLKQLALNKKKAEVIKKKYTGKNLNDYAKATNSNVQNMAVTFGAGTLGSEAQGAVAKANKGEFVGPVEGNSAVYVFQVKDKKAAAKFEDKDLPTRLGEVANFKRINLQAPELFIGDRKVTNNLLLFTADESAK